MRANKGIPEEWCLWVVNIRALSRTVVNDVISHACQWGSGKVRSKRSCATDFALEMHIKAYFYRAVQIFLLFQNQSKKERRFCMNMQKKKKKKFTVVVLVWIIDV